MKRSRIVALVFTALALVLVCITFSTPSMYILRIHKDKKVQTEEYITKREGNRTIHVYQPVTVEIPTIVTLSCGLWYFSACVPTYCDVHSYQHAKHAARHFDPPLQGMDMEEIYNHVGDIAKFAFLEFQVEITAALVCLIVSMVTTVFYYKAVKPRRCVGLTAFINGLLAGVFLAVATAKCATLIVQSKVLLSSSFDFDMTKVSVRFSYGLLMSGLAAIILFGTSLALLLTLTSKKTLMPDDDKINLIHNDKSREVPSEAGPPIN